MPSTTLSRLRLIRRFRLRNVDFPVFAFELPTRLRGYANGQVPDEMLATWTDHRGRTCRMAPEFLRSWQALVWVAHICTGRRLTFTSSADVYRTLPQQEAGWRRRMTLVPLPGRPSRLCGWPDGVKRRWWLLPFMAGIACPGSSNHGWFGAAVDHDTDRGRTVAWLRWAVEWFPRFGYGWESASEDWHVRNNNGDAIPRAVLEVEAAQRLATLQRGSTGDPVKLVQGIVGAAHDGQFGPKTQAAVIVWQQTQRATFAGLRTDGVWDQACWWVARQVAP